MMWRPRWLRGLLAALAVSVLVAVLALALPVALGGNTTYTIVAGRSMEPVLESGDLVVTLRQDSYNTGDVIVYEIPDGHPGAGVKVIHRIVATSAEGEFFTAGDNQGNEDVWRPTADDVLGAHWRTIPAGGVLFLWLRSPIVLGLLVSSAAFRFGVQFVDAAATRRRLDGLPSMDSVGGINNVIVPAGYRCAVHDRARVVRCRVTDISIAELVAEPSEHVGERVDLARAQYAGNMAIEPSEVSGQRPGETLPADIREDDVDDSSVIDRGPTDDKAGFDHAVDASGGRTAGEGNRPTELAGRQG